MLACGNDRLRRIDAHNGLQLPGRQANHPELLGALALWARQGGREGWVCLATVDDHACCSGQLYSSQRPRFQMSRSQDAASQHGATAAWYLVLRTMPHYTRNVLQHTTHIAPLLAPHSTAPAAAEKTVTQLPPKSAALRRSSPSES